MASIAKFDTWQTLDGTTMIAGNPSGNVGIGLFPSTKLDVNGRGRFVQDAAGTTGALVLRQNSGDTVGAHIQWVTNNNSAQKGHILVDTSSNMIFAPGITERMRIDVDGRVTMPYQPVASVSYGGSDIGATNIIPLNTTPIVRGGMTISSNRITVPVTGTYFVGWHHLATNTGTQIQIRVNGTSINSGAGSNTQMHPNGTHGNGSVQATVAMNANDYIEFFVINQNVHGNSSFNRMYAFLLG